MKSETVETIIWIFCIVVCLSLAVKIQIDANQYNCGECTVQLFNEIAGSNAKFDFGTYVIADLYQEYIDGHCKFTWSPTQGYMHNA